jgi:hypothetical protein
MITTSSLPIIGQTRTWKEFRFVCQAVGKPPRIAAPGAQPEITGFMIGFQGLRSDDLPVQSLNVIPLEQFKDVQTTLTFVGICTQQFESFRTCSCLPKHPCDLHKQLAPVAS